MRINIEKATCRSVAALLGLSFCACASTAAHVPQQVSKPAPAASKTFEQDRKAILAMAGEFVVRFQFLETAALRDGYELTKPYLADATEIVEIVEDSGSRIDLQHLLLVGDNGRVVKHWRQTWTYEPSHVYEFRGNRTWVPRAVERQEAQGGWSQVVYQVDDSPRYAAVGRWRHVGNLSSWESKAWRPLPRREYTKRSDYDVLVARNRHTITPAGWVHEQDNYKLVLGDAAQPVIALEAGLNVYTRTAEVDFSKVRDYWAATKEFWSDVRTAWTGVLDGSRTVHLEASWQERPLYQHMFALAQAARDRPDERDTRKAKIRETIDAFASTPPGDTP